MFLVIYTLVMMILPQLIRSIVNIIYSFPHYVNVVEDWLNSIVEKGWKLNPDMINQVNQYSSRLQEYLTNTLLPQMQSMMKKHICKLSGSSCFPEEFPDRSNRIALHPCR